MGIRIHRNTWSAPLQLIDSWLPQPVTASAGHPLTAVAQRFARAGWLGHSAVAPEAPAVPAAGRAVTPKTLPCSHRTATVRVVHAANAQGDGMRSDSRVVLSGRMADVCAELERLAAMEPSLGVAHH